MLLDAHDCVYKDLMISGRQFLLIELSLNMIIL